MTFTKEYQLALLAQCADPTFMKEVGALMHGDSFQPELRPIVEELLTQFAAGRYLSTAQLTQLADKHGQQLPTPSGSRSFDRAEVVKFLCYRELRRSLAIAHQKHEEGDFDAAIDVVSRTKERFPQLGDVAPDILSDTVVLPVRHNLVATGLDPLDAILGGGLGDGDVTMILSILGGGKSSFMVGLGAEAIRKGHRIYHVTLEDPAAEIVNKYKANLTATVDPDWEVVKTKLRAGSGRLYIREHPAGCMTVGDLDREMPKDVSLCLIDYDDYVRPTRRTGSSYEEAGEVYGELKRLAAQRKIPVVIACQAKYEGYNGDVIKPEHAANSLEKPRKATHILSLTPSNALTEPTGEKWVLCSVAKNKHGRAGNVIHIKANFATCQFVAGKVE